MGIKRKSYAYTNTMLWNRFNDGPVIFLLKAEKNKIEYGKGVYESLLFKFVLHYPGCFFCNCNLPKRMDSRLVCRLHLQELPCDAGGRGIMQPALYLRGYICRERGLIFHVF